MNAAQAVSGVPLRASPRPSPGRAAAPTFDEVAASHVKRLFALAMTIVGEPADAEDVVQETLASAWRSWSRRHDPDASAWLTRICVNHAISSLRRRRRTALALWRSQSMTAHEERYRETMAAELLDVDRAYRRLSPRQRAVFALHFHHGYTVAQCAELIGCKPGTARSHLGRAVAQMRKEVST